MGTCLPGWLGMVYHAHHEGQEEHSGPVPVRPPGPLGAGTSRGAAQHVGVPNPFGDGPACPPPSWGRSCWAWQVGFLDHREFWTCVPEACLIQCVGTACSQGPSPRAGLAGGNGRTSKIKNQKELKTGKYLVETPGLGSCRRAQWLPSSPCPAAGPSAALLSEFL